MNIGKEIVCNETLEWGGGLDFRERGVIQGCASEIKRQMQYFIKKNP